jgi:UDPglucose 6-dehydrogenase
MKPDRIIVGVSTQEHKLFFQKLYGFFIKQNPSILLILDRASSELSKYAANTMLAVRISFMNEISQLCEKIGADIESVRLGMGSDPRIGPLFLKAGAGFGGSCFPKDLKALIKIGIDHDLRLTLSEAAYEANTNHIQKMVLKIKFALDRTPFKASLPRKQIAIWGLAFKPQTDDVRDAPALDIMKALLQDEGISIFAHDPQGQLNFMQTFGPHKRLAYKEDPLECLEGADVLVLVTEWAQYKTVNWKLIKTKMRTPVIVDLRNQYEGQELTALGFQYVCVGRPNASKI